VSAKAHPIAIGVELVSKSAKQLKATAFTQRLKYSRDLLNEILQGFELNNWLDSACICFF
jgi:hypothetical protein